MSNSDWGQAACCGAAGFIFCSKVGVQTELNIGDHLIIPLQAGQLGQGRRGAVCPQRRAVCGSGRGRRGGHLAPGCAHQASVDQQVVLCPALSYSAYWISERPGLLRLDPYSSFTAGCVQAGRRRRLWLRGVVAPGAEQAGLRSRLCGRQQQRAGGGRALRAEQRRWQRQQQPECVGHHGPNGLELRGQAGSPPGVDSDCPIADIGKGFSSTLGFPPCSICKSLTCTTRFALLLLCRAL